MLANELKSTSWEQAAQLLGVAVDASDEALRAAYIENIRRHPPDRDPESFERIRDAYDQLRDPSVRAKKILEGPNPADRLENLVIGKKQTRKFVGPRLWLDLLKENRS
jgi:curved DNA-binding protein CbpA